MTEIKRFCGHKQTLHEGRQVICCDCGKQFGSDFKRHAETPRHRRQQAYDLQQFVGAQTLGLGVYDPHVQQIRQQQMVYDQAIKAQWRSR